MSKSGGNQTVTTQPDAATQAYVNQMRGLALGYAGLPGPTTYQDPARANRLQAIAAKGGMLGNVAQKELDAMAIPGAAAAGAPKIPDVNPALNSALQNYGGYAGLGALGVGALSGGANPWMAATNPLYADIRSQTLNSIGDQAALAGAFGGSRQGVAEGEALRGIAKDQAADAYNRATQAAQLGLAGIGGQAGLGQYLTEYPQAYAQRQLNLLGSAIGPYGQTQSQPTTSSPFGSALGGAAIGAQFGPLGALAGGGLGLLGGLFS